MTNHVHVGTDLLSSAPWECAPTPHGAEPPTQGWVPIRVPGTAAQALAEAGDPHYASRGYDSEDWWFRCRFTASDVGSPAPHTLRLGGLATIADVWFNGDLVLHSENMFVAHEVRVTPTGGSNELLIRCAALTSLLARRRPRARWKCAELMHPNLRWIRTTNLGRLTGGIASPAPVGPWRPVTLRPVGPVAAARLDLKAHVVERGHLPPSGVVELRVAVTALSRDPVVEVLLTHGDEEAGRATATISKPANETSLRVTAAARVEVPHVRLWWPHTHGDQPLYDVTVLVDGTAFELGRVGFRTVLVDRTDGGFTVSVNGTPVYCRGSCWTPIDPVSLAVDEDIVRDRLELARAGNQVMLRITGTGVYESRAFFDGCDELGLLVWQDCMFSFFDVPEEPDFLAGVRVELEQVFRGLQGRPSLAVVCGGSESEQEAAFLGLPEQSWVSEVAARLAPRLVDALLSGTPYVHNTPGESPLPSMANAGPSHYFGVGGYQRPLADATSARVRFASECLAFAAPPEPLDEPQALSLISGLGHAPAWKSTVHRDSNTTWDLEDTRDWYTAQLLGVDPWDLRRKGGEAPANVARATIATVVESVLGQWRRGDSPCAGALVLQAHDPVLGGGPGMVDALGRPKSSWYVMRRLMAPAVVILSDDGINGLGLHVASDRRDTWSARVRLDAWLPGAVLGDTAVLEATVSDGSASLETASAFGGFRDLSYAHRFGPPTYDAVTATLLGLDEAELSQATFFPEQGTRLRPVEQDLGLRAEVLESDEGAYRVSLSTERIAQWVSFDVPGWIALDSWFHLVPGSRREVELQRLGPGSLPPRGHVRALNLKHAARIDVANR